MKINRSKESIYQLLAQVPDPEIPVVNIIEMGMIRDVIVTPEKVEVFLCPTYSGCPAMDMIESMVKEKLSAFGALNVLVTLVYKPAWTTNWMTKKTKKKLKEYGISPPEDIAQCPQCNSTNIELISEFGATACKSLYKCSDCLEPFEHFKCI